jgi:hypothetical protein
MAGGPNVRRLPIRIVGGLPVAKTMPAVAETDVTAMRLGVS